MRHECKRGTLGKWSQWLRGEDERGYWEVKRFAVCCMYIYEDNI
jgi:hypothetical protein